MSNLTDAEFPENNLAVDHPPNEIFWLAFSPNIFPCLLETVSLISSLVIENVLNCNFFLLSIVPHTLSPITDCYFENHVGMLVVTASILTSSILTTRIMSPLGIAPWAQTEVAFCLDHPLPTDKFPTRSR